ncbi:MAG: hypothetical protein C0516_10585 [Gemmatimonas sp.]|nr:hypothetical protein [Gemmatimonas sp.]
MSIADRPLHCLGCKVSHNTFEMSEFDLSALYDAGCRGIELDIHQEPSKWEWNVFHTGRWDPNKPKLSAYLEQLHEWVNEDLQMRRDPFFVILDLKNGNWTSPDFPDRLDDYILDCLPDTSRIFSPVDLVFTGGSLYDHVAKVGWPALRHLRGQLIFWLSGSETGKRRYALSGPAKHLCFSDLETNSQSIQDSGQQVLLNVKYDVFNASTYRTLSSRMWSKRALLSRAYNVNSSRAIQTMKKEAPRFNLLAVSEDLALDKSQAGKGFWDTGAPL